MTWLLIAVSLLINTPVPVLPETIFLSLVVAPPIRLFPDSIKIPPSPLPENPSKM
jgi:hypothetical protein